MPMGCRGLRSSSLGSEEGYGSLARQAGRPTGTSVFLLLPGYLAAPQDRFQAPKAPQGLCTSCTCYLFASFTIPFLSFRSLLRHRFLQEASLVPQPKLSASSRSPPRSVLIPLWPWPPCVVPTRHCLSSSPMDWEPQEVWICLCHSLLPLLSRVGGTP